MSFHKVTISPGSTTMSAIYSKNSNNTKISTILEEALVLVKGRCLI
ncbi:hypothetical protein O9992_00090 [Vibrio lentus]|nr:hypothetical protein [Vibrio lentus]